MNIKPGSAYNKLKVKFAQGGKVPPGDGKTKTYTDKAEYDKALQAYNDSLINYKVYNSNKSLNEKTINTVGDMDLHSLFPKKENRDILPIALMRTGTDPNFAYYNKYKKPVVIPEYKEPTMAQGKMESEVKPITELMMPSGQYMDKDAFISKYGEKPWLKATGQKFAYGGKLPGDDKTKTYTNKAEYDKALQAYNDSLDVYNLDKKVENYYKKEYKLPQITKEEYETLKNKEGELPRYTFNDFAYERDKKAKQVKSMDDYIMKGTNSNYFNQPDYLENAAWRVKNKGDRDINKYQDNVGDFAITLPDGSIKTPEIIYDGKPDWDVYSITSPDGKVSRSYSLDFNGKPELNNIYSPIQPIRTDYYGKDQLIDLGGINTSSKSTGWYTGKEKPTFKETSNKSYTNYTIPISTDDVYKAPVIKPKYDPNAVPEIKPTMAKGTMESEPKPITELMMPDGTKWSKEKFVGKYGEPQWMKATGQKFAFGGKMNYDVGGNFKPMNKDGTYGVQEKPEANTSWTTGVSMAGNMVQGTQDFSKSPNASMYKTEDAVWDTVGQLGPQGALIGGITDMMNTALRPIRESNDKKAGTSGYNEGLTIAGGLLNPLAALQTRGKYEGGYTDITGKGYEKYMAGLNRRAKFRENIGDFDANMNANINQISYLNSSPTFAKGGKMCANGGQMTTEYKTGGTHEQNPNGGIPIGNSLMEEGEIRFDYLENKQPKSYIFSNRIKYKK